MAVDKSLEKEQNKNKKTELSEIDFSSSLRWETRGCINT